MGSGKIAIGKLSQALDYGALTYEIEGDFDDAMRRVVEVADELGPPLLRLETLAVSFLVQPATGQIQPQALGDQHRLLGGHLADQQR